MSIPYLTQAAEFRRGEDVRVTGEMTDTVFAAGETVTSDFTSKEDAFLAGQSLDVRARTSENLFVAGGKASFENPEARMAIVAGGEITFRQAKFHDLIVAGGDVTVSNSTIEDDLISGSGKLVIDRDSKVLGDATIAAGNLKFDGTASKNLMLRGGEVALNGSFQGNVDVHAEHLRVGPNAIIQGTLAHQVRDVDIDPSAKIVGGVRALEPGNGSAWPVNMFKLFAATLFGLGLLLPPALVALFMPLVVAQGRDEIRRDMAGMIGRGFVSLILIPIVIVLLFMSVVGIPVGVLMLALAFIFFVIAHGIGIFTAADRARLFSYRKRQTLEALEARPGARFGWTLLTAIVLVLLMAIPVLGFLLNLIVFLEGLGALYMQIKKQIRWKGWTSSGSRETSGEAMDLKLTPPVT